MFALLLAKPLSTRKKKIVMGAFFDLKDNWKIYWRSPGDAGFPHRSPGKTHTISTRFCGTGPCPRFTQAGLETIGYEKRVIFPLEISIADPSIPLRARFTIDYLICRDICRPGQVSLKAEVPPGHGQLSDSAASLDDALQRILERIIPARHGCHPRHPQGH